MLDLIKKWWNRKWSDFTFDSKEDVLDNKSRRIYSIMIYKSVSNDGLVRFRKVNK